MGCTFFCNGGEIGRGKFNKKKKVKKNTCVNSKIFPKNFFKKIKKKLNFFFSGEAGKKYKKYFISRWSPNGPRQKTRKMWRKKKKFSRIIVFGVTPRPVVPFLE
ncbi:UNVERIFIED_CONTAM: hypothetical protein DV031_16365 [Lacticaseibacillus paracasei]|nr:hypothetical protein [Lacticaseibacillus paracasei]